MKKRSNTQPKAVEEEPKRTIQFQRRNPATLTPHPRQQAIFDDMPPKEFAVLVASVRTDGIRNPPEILPDGTIIKGHQRTKAAMQLGLTEIDVIVRTDLADASPQEIERELVEDNMVRRHLGPLTIARCYQAMKMRAFEVDRRRRFQQCDIRDELATYFGLSGRQLDRLVQLLRLPRSLHPAIDSGELPCSTASKILRLPSEEQERIASAYTSGNPIKRLIDTSQANKSGPMVPSMAIRSLKQATDRTLEALKGPEGTSVRLNAQQRRTLASIAQAISAVASTSR